MLETDNKDNSPKEEELEILLYDKKIKVKKGTTPLEILEKEEIQMRFPALAAIHNNKLLELTTPLETSGKLEFINIEHTDGMRIYQRSLSFVLVKAVRKLFRHSTLKIEHSIGDGLYCTLEGLENLTGDEVLEIEKKMWEIIKADRPFIHLHMPREKAIELFLKHGYESKARLFKYRKEETCSVYELDGDIDYFYGYLAPRTGVLGNFHLIYQPPGFILSIPSPNSLQKSFVYQPQSQFFNILRESKHWGEILGIEDVGQLNETIRSKNIERIILVAEALHEKRLAQIADEIKRRSKLKLILVAGPSSSGKTTFVKRLMIQLLVCGITPHAISLDNYFLDREKTPTDADGVKDFESLMALDINKFQNDLSALLAGKEVNLPKYNFTTGKSEPTDEAIKLSSKDVLLVEGIHALNPRLIRDLNPSLISLIYISALTQINIDSHNRISTTDTRLIRRIVRDNQFRNYKAVETIRRWPLVRRGENNNIFPYQENADFMFNSALIYELAVLKNFAEPLLSEITRENPEYMEAQRLLKFLSYFHPIDPTLVPSNSILREFIGGSRFKY